ncbi:uncharacterized protein LOC141633037 [Silene latifolia]|uniref:uncharacterized protein LOC141633037 n=1 Tax=Silene latifolia TaxID=37657 RepID=UPI003D76F3AA
MRLNRQGGMVGVRLSGRLSQYTFVDALKSTATPGGGVVKSGKDPPYINTNSYHWFLESYGAQFLHMMVHSKTDGKKFLLTMIYAFNDLHDRIELWNFLKGVANHCSDPWLWLGDFNTFLSPVERLGGHTTDAEMEHFQECVSLCFMEDITATGALFTWFNKHEATERVYSRLNRAMGNLEWMELFGDYIANFHPEGLLDHFPCTLVDTRFDIGGKKSFKYFNMWGTTDCFKGSVKGVWNHVY